MGREMILFVGDKPSSKMKPGAKAFQGAACEARLKEWAEYLTGYSRLETIIRESKPFGYNREYWTVNANDGNFESYLETARKYPDIVVALGNNASDSLTKLGTPHFKLPHPSGRNRQINDKEYIQSRLNACKSYIESFKEKK
jgi:hypothetical protein